MASGPKSVMSRIAEVTQAWASLRPTKSFGGFTLDQFKEAVKGSQDVRAKIAELEGRAQDAMAERDAVDAASVEAMQRVINAVKGDPEEGDDGGLYAALGYVRKSTRSSGLTRRKAKEAASSTA